MVYGAQCVMMAGTVMMPLQCADNWDTTIVCCVYVIVVLWFSKVYGYCTLSVV